MNTCLQSNNSDNKAIERVLPKCLLVPRKSVFYTEIMYFRVIPHDSREFFIVQYSGIPPYPPE